MGIRKQLTEAEKRDIVERELRHFNLEFSQKYNRMIDLISIQCKISVLEAERLIEEAMSLS